MPTRFLHDCRRTAARNLIRASFPERVAMLLTRHKSRAIFDRYNIIHEQELLETGRRSALMATSSSWTVVGGSGCVSWRIDPTEGEHRPTLPAPRHRTVRHTTALAIAPARRHPQRVFIQQRHTGISPRWTSARSYAGQFPTW